MKAKEFPLNSPVEVTWRDSASRGKWDTLEEYSKHEPCPCRTVGYLLKQDKRFTVIVQSQHTGGLVADSIAIPTACITRLRRLKVGRA